MLGSMRRCSALLSATLSVACLMLSVRLACGQKKLNISTAVAAPFPAIIGVPTPPCNNTGICAPVSLTLPPNTLMYWCGFQQTHKSFYNVTVTSSRPTFMGVNSTTGQNITVNMLFNLSTILIRERDWHNCPGYNNLSICYPMSGSVCDTVPKCSKAVPSLAMPDWTCLIVANSHRNPVNFTLWMNNAYDTARFNGVCVTIFFIVMASLAFLTFVGYTIYDYNWGSNSKVLENPHYHPEPVAVVSVQQPLLDGKPAAPQKKGWGWPFKRTIVGNHSA